MLFQDFFPEASLREVMELSESFRDLELSLLMAEAKSVPVRIILE